MAKSSAQARRLIPVLRAFFWGKMVSLEFHDIANQFPMMSEAEFSALVDDIKANGQREPIVLFEGKVLDGRNRYRACETLAIEPIVKEFEGSYDQAVQLGISSNLKRRHLSKSQIAMFVAYHGLATAPDGLRSVKDDGKLGIREAAERYAVAHQLIYKAFFVLGKSSELAKQILRGDLSITKAESQIRANEEPSNKPNDNDQLSFRVKRMAKLRGLESLTKAKKAMANKLLDQLEALVSSTQSRK